MAGSDCTGESGKQTRTTQPFPLIFKMDFLTVRGNKTREHARVRKYKGEVVLL